MIPTLRKLIYAGVTEERDPESSLRIQLANISALLAISSNILYSILFYSYDSLGKFLIPAINTPFAFILSYAIYLNHKHYYTTSRVLILSCIPLVVFLTTYLFYGNLLGAHYNFLLIALLPFLVLSYKHKYLILAYFLLNLFLYTYIGFLHEPPYLTPESPFFDFRVRESFQISSVASCFLILAAVLFYFLRNTERNQQEIKRTNLYKERIFSILAHDLKGPIGSMGTFLSILLESWKKYSAEEITNSLKELQKNANQSYVVLENLLEWVKNDTKRYHFIPERVGLEQLLQNSLELFSVIALEKKIHWDIKVAKEHIAFVDERMMASIFRNLLSNAIKFSPIGGKVEIESKDLGHQTEISFLNEGKPIPLFVQEAIMNRHPIKSEFGTMGERGTGIGLLVSYELLLVQSGEFWIESREGYGTKMILRLPKGS
ncbi:GHKL domain protein [Leptospira ryugenii]|uniref:histidine kinase n=1 Tax=Leptospira ryugenii TaxID=1917863 RepID=A0A2P2DZ63_9LEPT|nr:HAMP domain-containing sensor histidine kinase [Leptospira ryugenii]GBF49910.1 GHKL domain protein [Leptospira ryugenii]